MFDASDAKTASFPVVKLLEATKTDTEEITRVPDTLGEVPSMTKTTSVTTTLTMPVVTQQKCRRIINWLNSWGPTKVLVLPTAAVVGLYIGTLIAAPDKLPPDTFAKKPSVTRTVEPVKPSKTVASSNATVLPADRHTNPQPAEPMTTPMPTASAGPTPSSSVSVSPSSTLSPPSHETPGKGDELSPQPSASTTTVPSVSPSDTPITSEAPEETPPATGSSAASETADAAAAENSATP